MSGNEEKYNQHSSKEGHGTDEGATSATTKDVNTNDLEKGQCSKRQDEPDNNPMIVASCCLL